MNRSKTYAECLPVAAPNMRIGILGGAFNPAHTGHREISRMALRRLGLDRLWWSLTPGHNLKTVEDGRAYKRRLAQAAACANHPRIDVTAFEVARGFFRTLDTLQLVQTHYPQTHFVWIMGADNLRVFHRWSHWREIMARVPIAVFDRPGNSFTALASPAARWGSAARISEKDAANLAHSTPPAWVFCHGQRLPHASRTLREGITDPDRCPENNNP